MNKKGYEIREALPADIPFLVETIVAADKGNTDKLSYATLYGISEKAAAQNIGYILEQEVAGCELSLSSYLVAVKQGKQAAAFGSWVEVGANDALPSGILKANLLGFVYGIDAMKQLAQKANLLQSLLIRREPGTLQLENLYVSPAHRGNALGVLLTETHLKWRKAQYSDLAKAQVQLFTANEAARVIYIRCGFSPLYTRIGSDNTVLQYLGHGEKLLMENQF